MNTNDDGSVGIPIKIKDQTLNMLVDTGGSGSLITEAAATKLDLTMLFSFNSRGMFFGGSRVDHYATAYDINFGGLKANQFNFFIMPKGVLSPGVDGLLGPEILHAFDDDFDFA